MKKASQSQKKDTQSLYKKFIKALGGKSSGKGTNSENSNKFRVQGKCFFLTFKGTTPENRAISKDQLVQFFYHNPNDRSNSEAPIKYHLCLQQYADGQPHIHAIVLYHKTKDIKNPLHYDYDGIHPNIQQMRNLKAALVYAAKTDPTPTTNMDVQAQIRSAKAGSRDLFSLLEQEMYKDPFNFNAKVYLANNNLFSQAWKASYSKALTMIKDQQQALCNNQLVKKPKCKVITPQLIYATLSHDELAMYQSWKDGYDKIIQHLNTIFTEGWRRQQKQLNLLITGPPNIGKSALIYQRYNPSLHTYCAVYPMGMDKWFPEYKSDVYDCIYWNEAKLTTYKYDIILKILDGSPVDLPVHGRAARKIDNPTVIMCSNMTLQQLIKEKFPYRPDMVKLACDNLAVRIRNVIVPKGKNLFFLQKLLISN